ncbi:hypothetical protein BH23GEM5_BH23GEM5_07670 [soil metagenome]
MAPRKRPPSTATLAQPGSIQSRLEFILARYEAARLREPFGTEHALWDVFRKLEQDLARHPAVRKRPTLHPRLFT